MLLKKIRIEDKGKVIIDTDLSKTDIKDAMNTTLILGENGVGKSFCLKIITDIFIYLEKALKQSRKPKYEYESFHVEYILDNNDYSVTRVSSREIKATKNGKEIDYKSINLPARLLAISFMVNDKFVFSKNMEGTYKYLGVRSSSNCTYTSSITRKLTENLIISICNKKYEEVLRILRMIGFDEKIEFEYSDAGNKKTCFANDYDRVNDIFKGFPYRRVSAYFWKRGKKVTFDNCSSGEKHILFAFVSLLREIENESLILIDEPEISLHPEWQIQYISKLQAIFGYYSKCHFILASHSHYFVSDLPKESSSIVIFRHSDETSPQSELLPFDTYAWSAENIIYNVFGLRTTRNYYFETDISMLLKAITKYTGDRTEKKEIGDLIKKLKHYSLGDQDPLNDVINEAEELIGCSVDG